MAQIMAQIAIIFGAHSGPQGARAPATICPDAGSPKKGLIAMVEETGQKRATVASCFTKRFDGKAVKASYFRREWERG